MESVEQSTKKERAMQTRVQEVTEVFLRLWVKIKLHKYRANAT